MALWSEEDPGVGDMSVVSTFAAEQDRRARRLETAISGITSINGTVTAGATGAAVDAWASRVSDFEPKFRRTIAWLDARKLAADVYAETVDSIATRTSEVRQRIASLSYAYRQVQAQPIPEGAMDARLAELDAQTSYERSILRGLADERASADSTFQAALDSSLDVEGVLSWDVAKAIYGAGALTGTYGAFRTRQQAVTTEVKDLVGEAVSGKISEQDRARLIGLLESLESDPELASQVWLEVGGEKARDLVWALADDLDSNDLGAEAVPVAALLAVRASIGSGSALWTPADAGRFADDFMPDEGLVILHGTGLDALDFLFAAPDEAPMSATLATAFATRLDLIERGLPRGDQQAGLRVSSALQPELYALSRSSHDPHDERAQVFDPMAQIFTTMSNDPGLSLQWLTDTTVDPLNDGMTLGDSRIAHYYGTREWIDDGWAGAASAWESAMLTPGGFHEGSTAGDVYDAQVYLTEEVVAALGSREGAEFAPEGLSDRGAESMATSLNVALPWLMETTIAGRGLDDGGGAYFLGVGDQTVMPVTDSGDLARLWGTVGGNDAGLVALSNAVGNHQIQVLQAASLSDVTGVKWETAFNDYVELEAFHLGSIGGVEELQARINDELVADGVNGAGAVVGLIPIPMSEKIPEGMAWGFDQLTGMLQSGVEDGVVATWGNELESASAKTNAAIGAGYVAMDSRLDAFLSDSLIGVSDDMTHAEVSDFKSALLDDYMDQYVSALEYVDRPELAEAFRREVAGGS
ncbi:DUF6571 family protein [Demequina sediminicola]|uniref:DUF6571 family protein n=1 Tax=Demequina sediminicola TaxID=1095026 RepID=UPI000780B368|nr:DUF6571 family protein [Demequina sediminicola]